MCSFIYPKSFILVFLSNCLLLLGVKTYGQSNDSDRSMLRMHKNWMKEYGVSYSSPEMESKRYNIYKDNLNFINSFNSLGHAYTLGPNQFADLTNQEFILIHLKEQEDPAFPPPRRSLQEQRRRRRPRPRRSRRPPRRLSPPPPLPPPSPPPPPPPSPPPPAQPPPPPPPPSPRPPPGPIPDSIDWRTFGALNPVRDQKRCGSCWAFGAVSTIEAICKIKTGVLPSLSEQELVDCDTKSFKCEGGFIITAYEWVIQNKGLNNRTNYPYTAANGTCNADLTAVSVATIRNYTRLPPNNETALKEAVSQQPVYVSIAAGGFQFYKGGIYNGTSEYNINHGMTAVGYGQDQNGTKYWILRNSWGIKWGESGYMRILRDYSEDSRGYCGLAIRPIYPVF